MKHRFRFIAQKDDAGDWQLDAEQRRHLARVLRLKAGDDIELANGRGEWAIARLSAVTPDHVEYEIQQEFAAQPVAYPLHLAVACLKPAVFEDLLPSLVELGVDGIHVFAQPQTDKKWLAPKVRNRWERIVHAAMKQCKRPWLPILQVHDSLASVLDKVDESWDCYYLSGDASETLVRCSLQGPAALLVVGSEKGLAPSEITVLQQRQVSGARLGAHVLRAYTASIAGTAVIASRRDPWQ
jgi:16S rRNA (uracil1498-N3)-methyltransferase